MPRHRARLRPYPARADDARFSSSSPPRSLTHARSTETTAWRRARPAARNAEPDASPLDPFAPDAILAREFADVARLRGANARASADVGDASDAFEGGEGDEDGRARAEDEETWATGRENSPS